MLLISGIDGCSGRIFAENKSRIGNPPTFFTRS
jgi:hypothetical protein